MITHRDMGLWRLGPSNDLHSPRFTSRGKLDWVVCEENDPGSSGAVDPASKVCKQHHQALTIVTNRPVDTLEASLH